MGLAATVRYWQSVFYCAPLIGAALMSILVSIASPAYVRPSDFLEIGKRWKLLIWWKDSAGQE